MSILIETSIHVNCDHIDQVGHECGRNLSLRHETVDVWINSVQDDLLPLPMKFYSQARGKGWCLGDTCRCPWHAEPERVTNRFFVVISKKTSFSDAYVYNSDGVELMCENVGNVFQELNKAGIIYETEHSRSIFMPDMVRNLLLENSDGKSIFRLVTFDLKQPALGLPFPFVRTNQGSWRNGMDSLITGRF